MTTVPSAPPYAGEADIPAIGDLLNLCSAAYRLNTGVDVEALRAETRVS